MARDLTGHRRIAVVVADQALASAAWYAPVLLVGRAVTPGEFGVFLIAFGAVATALAVSRAMFGIVVGMDAAAMEHDPGLRRTLRLSAGGVTVLGLLVSLSLLAASLLVPIGSGTLLLLAVGAALVLPQDLARYTAVARARPGLALLVDLVWCVPPLVGIGLDVGGVVRLSGEEGMLLWLAAVLGSVLVAGATGLLARPQYAGLLTWWRSDRRRRDLGSESLLGGAVPVVNGWGAALVGGAVAVAAVRGAAMLFAPVMMLMLVLTLAAVPEAHRRSPADARRLMLALTGLLTLAAVVWGGIVLVLPTPAGRGILGESWDVARPVVPWVCLEYVGVAWWTGGAAMLRYASATRTVLRVRLAYAPAAVALPVVLLALRDDPRTFAAVLAVLAWVVGPASVALGLRAMRRHDAPERSAVAGAGPG